MNDLSIKITFHTIRMKKFYQFYQAYRKFFLVFDFVGIFSSRLE